MIGKREPECYDYPILSIYDDIMSPQTCKFLLEKQQIKESSIIYIHIPFCSKQCVFCNYYKTSDFSRKLIDDYFDALKIEADYYSKILGSKTKIIGIHFGGGTPSVIPVKYYHQLIEHIKQIFLITDPIISFEGNVTSLNNASYINGLKKAGVNRVSFGVQSLNPLTRSFLKLKSDALKVKELCRTLISEGIVDFNADLMFNLPYQTPMDFENDIHTLFEFGVQAIDLYSLLVYPETLMFHYLRKHDMWNLYLDKNSINQYENVFSRLSQNSRYKFMMSNTIARKDAHDNTILKSQLGNNKLASNNVIGLGASSRGYLSGFKYKNHVGIDDYISSVRKSLIGIQLCRILTEPEIITRRLVLFPNFMFINVNDGPVPQDKGRILSELTNQNILSESNGRYSFVSGMNFWAGNVSSMLMDLKEQIRMKNIVLRNRKSHLNMYNQDKMQIQEE